MTDQDHVGEDDFFLGRDEPPQVGKEVLFCHSKCGVNSQIALMGAILGRGAT